MLRETDTERQRDSFGLGNNYTYIQHIQTTTKQQQKVVGGVLKELLRIQTRIRIHRLHTEKSSLIWYYFKAACNSTRWQRTKVGKAFCLARAYRLHSPPHNNERKKWSREKNKPEREWERERGEREKARGKSETDSCGMFELVNCFALVCNIKNRMQSMKWMSEKSVEEEGRRGGVKRKLQKSQIPPLKYICTYYKSWSI